MQPASELDTTQFPRAPSYSEVDAALPTPPAYQETDPPKGSNAKVGYGAQSENSGNIHINVCAPQPQSTVPVSAAAPVVQNQPQAQVQAGQTVFVPMQQVVVVSSNLGDTPSMTTCSNCKQRVMTKVIYKPGVFSWMLCLLFILFGLICGCCLLPFFVTSLMDAHHSCPQCHQNLHIHKRM
ncbi:lipopolysaccharide-induced tumor necrosis factor-alpha factor homolog [Lepisosteus oculatus]|uniref:lipopolysaccharide-induced tumor necrosis factor-alpha factor homolog n=1 Tax=Lepisosteus oculatus TaxID=7918 RepID=UPI00073FCA16|nr:PREDICTED: lipopolysaccharide-induced tumor necrosis factor-alpha factor homolog [Lepisosteus oculatus]XP_015215595.1 PREDICTED: lipopolysaccharide-induced tumor necrosis factor-alpha factor homolog [Lepisosteus oculatus]